MPTMARRWIRLDVTWEDSAWLDALDGTAAGCWPRLLCVVKKEGVSGVCKRPAMTVLARRWRVPAEAIEALEKAAIRDGALAIDDGDWVVCAWAEYQERDTTTAERSKRYRESKHRLSTSRRDTVTHAVTGRDPSMSMSSSESTSVKKDKRKASYSLPAEWQPNTKHRDLAVRFGLDCGEEAERMRDWAASKDERRTNWDATFNNWLRNDRMRKPAGRSGVAGSDVLNEVKTLIRAAGETVFNAFAREQGYQKMQVAYPDLWKKHETTMRSLRYGELKTLIEAKNGFEYSNALNAQIKALNAA